MRKLLVEQGFGEKRKDTIYKGKDIGKSHDHQPPEGTRHTEERRTTKFRKRGAKLLA